MVTITLDDEPCCAKQGYHRKARHHDNSIVILSKTDSAAGRQENPLGFNAVIAPSSHLIKFTAVLRSVELCSAVLFNIFIYKHPSIEA